MESYMPVENNFLWGESCSFYFIGVEKSFNLRNVITIICVFKIKYKEPIIE
jgi:hypothetical protein